jgi:hypothetical protein
MSETGMNAPLPRRLFRAGVGREPSNVDHSAAKTVSDPTRTFSPLLY